MAVRYLIVECVTYSSEFVGEVNAVSGPYTTRKGLDDAWKELQEKYENDEDADVGDYEICIENGQNGRSTITWVEFEE